MNQPIDLSHPWWDGTISLPFTPKEWRYIADELAMLYNIPGFPETEEDIAIAKIIHTIYDAIDIEWQR